MREYYVFTKKRDERVGFYDHCILWWRERGRGYTCDLNNAGVFTDADKQANYPPVKSCIYVPKELVDAVSKTVRLAWWDGLGPNVSQAMRDREGE